MLCAMNSVEWNWRTRQLFPAPPMRTHRNAALKLDLRGKEVSAQLETVAETLYIKHRKESLGTKCSKDAYKKLHAGCNTQYDAMFLADNSRSWPVTDEALYSEAKKSFDDILSAFSAKPRVFKFKSVREKVWRHCRLLFILFQCILVFAQSLSNVELHTHWIVHRHRAKNS